MKAALRVLDSHSLIAYLENESGADKMIELFQVARDSGKALLLSVVNWGEIYYITLREAGRERAEAVAVPREDWHSSASEAAVASTG